jgi:hypothetical protein
MKSQWTVGKYLGAILYDVLTNLYSVPRIQKKWASYLAKVRRDEPDALDAILVSGAQNLNADKLKRISAKVQTYVTENRIMTKDELDKIHHENSTDSEDDDSNTEEEQESD